MAKKTEKTEWKYEAEVKRVEEILGEIEGGELDLTEVFDRFAVAVESLQQCEAFLSEQQEKVDLLLEDLVDTPHR